MRRAEDCQKWDGEINGIRILKNSEIVNSLSFIAKKKIKDCFLRINPFTNHFFKPGNAIVNFDPIAIRILNVYLSYFVWSGCNLPTCSWPVEVFYVILFQISNVFVQIGGSE